MNKLDNKPLSVGKSIADSKKKLQSLDLQKMSDYCGSFDYPVFVIEKKTKIIVWQNVFSSFELGLKIGQSIEDYFSNKSFEYNTQDYGYGYLLCFFVS